MLIVLTLLVTITHISLVNFKELSRVKRDKDLIELISNDLMFAQEWAQTHEVNVAFTINSEEHFYTISTNIFSVIKKVPFDRAIHFEKGTLGLEIYYNVNGNIRESGSLYMNTPQSRYKFIFNLGKGRFYVTKL
jgi:competence protein ComGD